MVAHRKEIGTSSSIVAAAVALLAGCGHAPARSERTHVSPVASAPTRKVVVLTDASHIDWLWSVSTDGTVRRLDWPLEGRQWRYDLEAGSDRLKPSPDGTRVAYVEARALVVRELATGRTTLIHRAAANTEVAITGWSPNGGALLYATLPHPAPDREAESDVFGDDPTYHRVDMTTGHATIVVLPGVYGGWLASGEIVVTADGGQKIVAVRDGAIRTLAETPFHLGQLRVSSDGTRIVASASRDGTGAGSTIEVVLAIDPATGATTPLTAPTGFAEQQWPALSPNNRRLAYLHVTHVRYKPTTQTLVVDGRELSAPSSELVGFTWLDDETIVLQRTDRLVVVRAETRSR